MEHQDPFADLLSMDTGAVVAAAAAVRETEDKPLHDRPRDEDDGDDEDDARPAKRQELEKREEKKQKKKRALKGPSLALALLADAAPSLTSEGDDWGWKIDDGEDGDEAPESLDFRGWKGVEAEAEAEGGGGIVALDLAGVANSSSSSSSSPAAFCLPPPGVMPLLFPKLKRLSLGGNSLRALPDDLGGGAEEGVEEEKSGKEKGKKGPSGGSGLEWLWLENNAFRRLPPQLSLVAGSLRHLSLALNPLCGQLGPRAVLASLRNLETLDLSECALEGVPDEIGELTLLTRLDLHSNRISSLPQSGALGKLRRLARLSLHSNELAGAFPEGALRGCSALEWLSLNSNRLTALPAGSLSDCTRLSRLSVHLNKLNPSVPADLSSLPHLEALSLFGNELSELPVELFAKGKLTKLARLPLWDNKLKNLPKGWATRGGMEGLQELWLSRNDLEKLEFFDSDDDDDDGDDDDGDEDDKDKDDKKGKKKNRDPALPSLTRLWIDGNGQLDAEKVIAEAARACPALQEVHADCARCRGGGGGGGKGNGGGGGGGGGNGGSGGGAGGACTRRRADGWKCTNAATAPDPAAPAPA